MARHLTAHQKEQIVKAIKNWKDPLKSESKITWPMVQQIAQTITGVERTRQALNKHSDIRRAYKDRNTGAVKGKNKKDLRIEKLEKEKKQLQEENALLISKFLRWSYNAKNATRVPVEIEDLEKPLPNPEFVPRQKKR